MKKLLLGLVASLAIVAANAAELKWHTSLPDAMAKAKAEKKLVFLEFTGSDWCPPCKQLHKEVLASKAFASYAADKYVLVELDFPRKKEQSDELKKANRALAMEFKVEGYPTVVILDAAGKELYRKVGFRGGGTAEDYIADLDKGIGK
jgi:protein disulfide-isomerase